MLVIAPALRNPELDVPALAETLLVNRRQLEHEIYGQPGIPAERRLDILRLYKARWLMRQHRANNLYELARRVGFGSSLLLQHRYLELFNKDPADCISRFGSQRNRKLRVLGDRHFHNGLFSLDFTESGGLISIFQPLTGWQNGKYYA